MQRASTVKRPSPALLLCLLASVLATISCATGIRLSPAATGTEAAEGNFSVLLHGCRYSNDIETMALLVARTSPYRFRFIDLPTATRTLPDLPAKEALREAAAFIRCTIHDTGNSVFRRITGPSGETVAYEMKPLFSRLEMGADEVILSHYVLHGDEVRVYLWLDPAVERTRKLDIHGGADP